MNIEKYSKLAWEATKHLQPVRNHCHASIILRDDKLVSLGLNRRKTHPLANVYGYRNNELHSELDALIRVPRHQRDGLVLLNFRFSPKGDLRMSRPCPLCLPWCKATFVEIHYSIPDGMVQMM